MAISKERIKLRQQELEAEINKGQQQLNLLDRQRAEIQDTMLRLSGAQQVLAELLETTAQPETAVEPPRSIAAG